MLSNISTEDLRAELERREKLQKEEENPKRIQNPDFAPLLDICQDYIDDLANKGYVDDDHSHYIYETAMTCCFGSDVWGWINRKK